MKWGREEAFGCIVSFTVPVPTHHIPETETGSSVSDNLVDNVSVVVFSTMLVGFHVRSRLFLARLLASDGRSFVAISA